ncbi:MAG: hypothetical protein AAGA60_11525 [Cyanobacteria bacterium P01_E01_bin.42]
MASPNIPIDFKLFVSESIPVPIQISDRQDFNVTRDDRLSRLQMILQPTAIVLR